MEKNRRRGKPWYSSTEKILNLNGYTNEVLQALRDAEENEWVPSERMLQEPPAVDCRDLEFSTDEWYRCFLAAGAFRGYPSALLFGFHLRCLSNIDVVGGKFTVTGSLFSRFYLPEHLRKQDPLPYPRFRFRNAGEMEGQDFFKRDPPRHWSGEEADGLYRVDLMVTNLEFFESFQLDQFPFDVQDCTMLVALMRGAGHPTTEPFRLQDGAFPLPVEGGVNMASELPDYDLLRPSLEVHHDDPEKPVVAVRFRVQRRWQWYAVNHMVLVGCISSLCFTVFALETKELGDRLQITVALLLTVTATKFVLGDMLPKISYLTVLDKYLLSAFGLIGLICAENVIVALRAQRLESDDMEGLSEVDRLDATFCFSMAGLWVLWHLVLVFRTRRRLSRIRKEFGPPIPQVPIGIPADALHSEAANLKAKIL